MRRLNVTAMICAVFIVMAAIACGSGSTESNNSSDAKDKVEDTGAAPNTCTTDAECVPDQCCHAKACVAKANGPKDCADMMCTMDCVDGAMDCGAGQCACLEGVCSVKWNK